MIEVGARTHARAYALPVSMKRPQEEVGDAMEHNVPSSEAWDCWINEDLKLDSESPMDVFNSIWDDVAQSNDSVARSLFACTPLPHLEAAPSFVTQDSPQTSGSWRDQSYVANDMLHLLADERASSSPCLSDSLEGQDGSFGNAREDLPSSSSSMWFMPSEESLSSPPHNEAEQAAESWMAGFNGLEVHSSRQESALPLVNPINATPCKMLPAKEHGPAFRSRCVKRAARPPSQEFLGSQHALSNKKFTAVRGKHTPKPTLVRSLSDSQVMEASLKPIVYPFALVKPCGIQGDVTLKDINQRINMASSTVDSPSCPLIAPSSSVSSPFSGKPVVAVTKIHTEGKGIITIMRTRSSLEQ